jgi:hypothetical protein
LNASTEEFDAAPLGPKARLELPESLTQSHLSSQIESNFNYDYSEPPPIDNLYAVGKCEGLGEISGILVQLRQHDHYNNHYHNDNQIESAAVDSPSTHDRLSSGDTLYFNDSLTNQSLRQQFIDFKADILALIASLFEEFKSKLEFQIEAATT